MALDAATLEPTLEADVVADPGLLNMLAEAATAVDSEDTGCPAAAAPTPAESAQVSSLLQQAVGAGTALASGLVSLSNKVFALSACFRRKLRADLLSGSYALSPAALYLLKNPKARGLLEGDPALKTLIDRVHNAGLSAAIEIGRVGRALAADAGCDIVIQHLKMYLAYKILRDSLNKVLKPKLLELKIRGVGDARGGPVVGIPLGLNIASQSIVSGGVETTVQTLNRLATECGAAMGITPGGDDNTMPTITAGQEEAAVAWLNAELEKETGSRTVTPGLSQPNRSSRFVAISGPNIGGPTGRSASKVQRNFLKELYDTFDKTDQQKMKERIDIFWAKVQARANYTGKTVASYLKTANEAIEKFLSDLAKSSVAARQRNAINNFLTSPSTPTTPVLDYENVDTLLNGLEGALRLNDIPASANSIARNNSAAKRPATNGAGGGGASTGGYRRSRRHRSKPSHRRSTRRRSTHRRSTRRRSTRRRSTRSHSKL